jgi:hypothetical protein
VLSDAFVLKHRGRVIHNRNLAQCENNIRVRNGKRTTRVLFDHQNGNALLIDADDMVEHFACHARRQAD